MPKLNLEEISDEISSLSDYLIGVVGGSLVRVKPSNDSNVLNHGLKGDGTTNDAVKFAEILANVQSGYGAGFYFPGSSAGIAKTYRMEGHDLFDVTDNAVQIFGDGQITSTIRWYPDADGYLFNIDAGQAYIKRGNIRDLQILTTDSTYVKKAIRAADISGYDFSHLKLTGFKNNGSIGMHIGGRDTSNIAWCDIEADRPIVFFRDPYESSVGLDADLFRIIGLSTSGVGSPYPGIQFEDGAYPWEVLIMGSVVAGGTKFIQVNSTGTLGQPPGITLIDCRHEQGYNSGVTAGVDDGSQYAFDIAGNATAPLHRVKMLSCKSSTQTNGTKLAHVRSAVLEMQRLVGGSAVDALNMDMVGIARLIACDMNMTGGAGGNTLTLAANMQRQTAQDIFRYGWDTENGIPDDCVFKRVS